MKKVNALLLSLAVIILLFCSFSVGIAESGEWQCPACGSINYDKFCPKDGTPRPENKGNSDDSLPYFSDTFLGYTVKLHLLSSSDDRAQSYSGPGTNYMSSGAYKPYKQEKIVAFFAENGWVYCLIHYQTAEDRCVYFRESDFDRIKVSLPNANSFRSFDGSIISDGLASWGPSSSYNLIERYPVQKGTPIKAFFQQNGYIYPDQ